MHNIPPQKRYYSLRFPDGREITWDLCPDYLADPNACPHEGNKVTVRTIYHDVTYCADCGRRLLLFTPEEASGLRAQIDNPKPPTTELQRAYANHIQERPDIRQMADKALSEYRAGRTEPFPLSEEQLRAGARLTDTEVLTMNKTAQPTADQRSEATMENDEGYRRVFEPTPEEAKADKARYERTQKTVEDETGHKMEPKGVE